MRINKNEKRENRKEIGQDEMWRVKKQEQKY